MESGPGPFLLNILTTGCASGVLPPEAGAGAGPGEGGRGRGMYNTLYKGLRQANVDEFTACRISVDLNPERFINREELLTYQMKTDVAMTALKSHAIEVSQRHQDTTVAFLLNRDQQIREECVQNQNETRNFLSGIDKRMAASDARLKQHTIKSEARLDKRMRKMDARAAKREARAAKREAQGRAENHQFLAEMDKREALRLAEQDKREALRLAEQDKRIAASDASLRQHMTECAAMIDQRISEVKLFVSQQTTGINRILLCALIRCEANPVLQGGEG